ncbi:MAG: PQQ-binding-like beta-propeller repeat protein [Pirellulales bacterium]
MRAVATFWLLALAWNDTAWADSWPAFRGADGSGVSTSEQLPLEWSAEQNVAWKTPIDGRGWSCPIVWEGKVFLTTAVPVDDPTGVTEPKQGLYFGGERLAPPEAEHRWELWCLDRESGQVLWKQVARQARPSAAVHIKNSYASETPVTDGQRVYAYFGAAGLYAYDLDGRLVWQKDLGPFPTRFNWGTASSPALAEGRLFLQCDFEGDSFLLALDAASGNELWRTPRNEKSNWSSPFVWRNSLRTELITVGTNRVRSTNLLNGETWWELGGMSVITSPTPVAQGDLLYVTSGYVQDDKQPLVAIRPGGAGELVPDDQPEAIAWRHAKAGSYIPSPLVYEGQLFVLYDRGFCAAFDAATGAEIFAKQRLGADRGANFTASPWCYRGHIFCLSEEGDTFVVKRGNTLDVVGVNSLGETCLSSPAMAGDRLFVRTLKHLWCLRAAPEE